MGMIRQGYDLRFEHRDARWHVFITKEVHGISRGPVRQPDIVGAATPWAAMQDASWQVMNRLAAGSWVALTTNGGRFMPAKKKRSASKRDNVKANNATFYAKRTARGRFKEMDEKGRSLSTDRRRRAKRTVRSGHGDQGDVRRRRAA